MSDAHTPGNSEDPIPRDREDEQAAEGEDPLAIPVTRDPGSEELPDTEESGTGPRGRPEEETVDPEQPTPDEPAD
ncbi:MULTISPECIES: hypothetical protein [unclassified Streptomyces]|uniref:hypothetical protein n=1 Tax=unclassified Streptomyces TaxID=2593676 RepID=UPI003316E5CE